MFIIIILIILLIVVRLGSAVFLAVIVADLIKNYITINIGWLLSGIILCS